MAQMVTVSNLKAKAMVEIIRGAARGSIYITFARKLPGIWMNWARLTAGGSGCVV